MFPVAVTDAKPNLYTTPPSFWPKKSLVVAMDLFEMDPKFEFVLSLPER